MSKSEPNLVKMKFMFFFNESKTEFNCFEDLLEIIEDQVKWDQTCSLVKRGQIYFDIVLKGCPSERSEEELARVEKETLELNVKLNPPVQDND